MLFNSNFKLYSLPIRLVQRNKHVELRQPALTKDFLGKSLCALSCPEAHCESLVGRKL
jgi:hypothetical protein